MWGGMSKSLLGSDIDSVLKHYQLYHRHYWQLLSQAALWEIPDNIKLHNHEGHFQRAAQALIEMSEMGFDNYMNTHPIMMPREATPTSILDVLVWLGNTMFRTGVTGGRRVDKDYPSIAEDSERLNAIEAMKDNIFV